MPDNLRVRHYLGTVFIAMEEYDEALVEFTEVLKRDPADTEAILQIADVVTDRAALMVTGDGLADPLRSPAQPANE